MISAKRCTIQCFRSAVYDKIPRLLVVYIARPWEGFCRLEHTWKFCHLPVTNQIMDGQQQTNIPTSNPNNRHEKPKISTQEPIKTFDTHDTLKRDSLSLKSDLSQSQNQNQYDGQFAAPPGTNPWSITSQATPRKAHSTLNPRLRLIVFDKSLMNTHLSHSQGDNQATLVTTPRIWGWTLEPKGFRIWHAGKQRERTATIDLQMTIDLRLTIDLQI
jgi:hypothetical protein